MQPQHSEIPLTGTDSRMGCACPYHVVDGVSLSGGRLIGPAPSVRDLEETVAMQNRVLARTKSILNLLRSRFVCLPDEVLTSIARLLVLMDPPEIGPKHSIKNCGWLALLWVCFRLREIIEKDGVIFALAYTQLPGQMESFKKRANGFPLVYRITQSTPRLASKHRLNGYSDTLHVTAMCERADLAACSVIHVDKRGDAIRHATELLALSRDRPLEHLLDLHLFVGYHISDPRILYRTMNSPGFDQVVLAPNLQHADFSACWLPVRSQNLRVLRLGWEDWTNTPRPPASIIHSALLSAHVTTLTDLRIIDALDCGFGWPHVGNEAHAQDVLKPSDLAALFFPNLVTLKIVGCPFGYSSLLDSISCPESTAVIVHAIIPSDTTDAIGVLDGLALKLPHHRSTINAINIRFVGGVSFMQRVHLYAWSCTEQELSDMVWRESTFGRPRLHLDLTFVGGAVPKWWDIVLTLVPRVGGAALNATHIQLADEGRFYLGGPIPWVRLSRTLPERLSILPFKATIRAIKRTVDVDDGEGEWLLDRLMLYR